MPLSARELELEEFDRKAEENAPKCGHSDHAIACDATVGYWLAVIRTQLANARGPMAHTIAVEPRKSSASGVGAP